MEVWRGRTLLLLLLAGTCAAVSIHNSITETVREAENHVEDAYLEDALETWLDNFDTYTFMVKQDLDHQPSEHEEEEEEGHEEEDEEHAEGEEDEEGGWNAPIAVTLNEHGLLNPHVDYQVTVESLVAEPGSIFLTLSKYENKSQCGVGGVTREDPSTAEANRVNSNGGRLAIGEDHNETIINFDMQQEANSNNSEGESEWDEVSHDYWWASGTLGSGGLLFLSFTPPECGCLMLSTYYALPIGNLTLVVGPQAYPGELQTLLCVDQLAPYEESEDYDDEEEASIMDESVDYREGDVLQTLALRQQNETESSDSETNGIHVVSGRSTRKDARRQRKQAKRLAKKKKRQQKRQNIRLAGRHQERAEERNTRRQARQGARNQRQGSRNQQSRAAKRAWKKLQKNRKRQRKNRRRNHLAGVAATNSTEGDILDHENHNATHPQTEERLIYRLLGEDFCTQLGNDTSEANEAEANEATTEAPEEAEEGEEEEGARGARGRGSGRALRRQMRRQRKQQRKMERRRSECSPGIKFCCKEGVKHKKNIMSLNMTAEDPAHGQMCEASDDIVTTFASHKYNIAQTTCSQVFRNCCHNFTSDIWASIRVMKAERRNKRKQRRKTRKQQRKVTRRTKKKNRKTNKRQHARQHNTEGEEEAVED